VNLLFKSGCHFMPAAAVWFGGKSGCLMHVYVRRNGYWNSNLDKWPAFET